MSQENQVDYYKILITGGRQVQNEEKQENTFSLGSLPCMLRFPLLTLPFLFLFWVYLFDFSCEILTGFCFCANSLLHAITTAYYKLLPDKIKMYLITIYKNLIKK